MDKKIISLSLLIICFIFSCKKDKPAPPEPEADFAGCKITSITVTRGGSRYIGNAIYYKNNQLYSIYTTNQNDFVLTHYYNQYKFSGSRLIEVGHVEDEKYTKDRTINYDVNGRVILLRYISAVDGISSINHELFYDNNGLCSYVLGSNTFVINGIINNYKTDSIVFTDYTPGGSPQLVERYIIDSTGMYEKNRRLKFEYDIHGNVVKKYTGLNDQLTAEYEYDMTYAYNEEYIKLQESLLWSPFLLVDFGLFPRDEVGKYPLKRKTLYDQQGASSVYNFDNTFDNNGRFVSQTFKTASLTETTDYNYNCK